MKKFTLVFLFSFLLNYAWENSHASLYANYQGGEITRFILFRAAIWDAVILTALAVLFIYVNFFKNKKWLIIPIGIAAAVAIELHALYTGRWTYAAMPIIPYLNVGLTPTLQLGLLGYFVYLITL